MSGATYPCVVFLATEFVEFALQQQTKKHDVSRKWCESRPQIKWVCLLKQNATSLSLFATKFCVFLGLWLIIRATWINWQHKTHLGISVYLLS
jgi:hypothetical protein